MQCFTAGQLLGQTHSFNLNLIASSPLVAGLIKLHLEALIIVVLPYILEPPKAHQMLGLQLPVEAIEASDILCWHCLQHISCPGNCFGSGQEQ